MPDGEATMLPVKLPTVPSNVAEIAYVEPSADWYW